MKHDDIDLTTILSMCFVDINPNERIPFLRRQFKNPDEIAGVTRRVNDVIADPNTTFQQKARMLLPDLDFSSESEAQVFFREMQNTIARAFAAAGD